MSTAATYANLGIGRLSPYGSIMGYRAPGLPLGNVRANPEDHDFVKKDGKVEVECNFCGGFARIAPKIVRHGKFQPICNKCQERLYAPKEAA